MKFTVKVNYYKFVFDTAEEALEFALCVKKSYVPFKTDGEREANITIEIGDDEA